MTRFFVFSKVQHLRHISGENSLLGRLVALGNRREDSDEARRRKVFRVPKWELFGVWKVGKTNCGLFHIVSDCWDLSNLLLQF